MMIILHFKPFLRIYRQKNEIKIKGFRQSTLNDSQVIVKFMEEDSSGRPSARHLNLAPVSSFIAEYSSVEVVVERPVLDSTTTETLMEIPRQKTNKHCLKTLTRKKMCNDQNTAHSHEPRRHESAAQFITAE